MTLAVLMTVAGFAGIGSIGAARAEPSTPSFGRIIDGYAVYDGQSTCIDGARPGVEAFKNLLLSTYPQSRSLGISRGCGVGGQSEHKEGRAFDWGVNINTPSEKAAAEDAIQWLLKTDQHGNKHANARRLGLMYMIWDHQIWKSYQSERGWQPYSGPSPHTDHVHFSFSWPGARQETTWWDPTKSGIPTTPSVPMPTWSNWQTLGGYATSSPDAASWGAGRLDVFVRGNDGVSLKHRSFIQNTGWGVWENLSYPCVVLDILRCGITSAPAAVSWGYGRIDVFARGPDHDLWHKYYRHGNGGWYDWVNLGSPPGLETPLEGVIEEDFLQEEGLNSGPDVASSDPGKLDVIVVGYNGALWRRSYDVTAGWSDWSEIGGIATSDPGVVSRKPGTLDIFYRNRDSDLVQRSYEAGTWKAPTVWTTTMRSAPDVASWSAGRLDVFWRGDDMELRQKTWSSTTGWAASLSLGGTLKSGPGAVSWDVDRIDVFVKGSDNEVKYRTYT